MKITDYMDNAMAIVTAELAERYRLGIPTGNDLSCYWDHNADRDGRGGYVEIDMMTLGVSVNDFLVMAGAEKANGANTMALVFDEGVIKWSKDEGLDSHYTTNEDARFYQDIVERFPEYRKYLAETIQIGMFTVQEPVRMAHESIHDLSDDERFDVYATLIRVAHELGLRDLHMGNWGFRGKDLTAPVIFDFSDRREPGSYARWHRLNTQFEWNDWECWREYDQALQQILDGLNESEPDTDDDGDFNSEF